MFAHSFARNQQRFAKYVIVLLAGSNAIILVDPTTAAKNYARVSQRTHYYFGYTKSFARNSYSAGWVLRTFAVSGCHVCFASADPCLCSLALF